MAVTNYISTLGVIRGEVTGGVMRNYITDALGSVVQTVANGTLENTYRYKPYGAQLAKTGTAADPSFLWNGGSGYRATKLTNAENYVRARIVSSTAAQWTTLDPLWPEESGYTYLNGSPGTVADPTGTSTCDTETVAFTGTCNAYKVVSGKKVFLKTLPINTACQFSSCAKEF